MRFTKGRCRNRTTGDDAERAAGTGDWRPPRVQGPGPGSDRPEKDNELVRLAGEMQRTASKARDDVSWSGGLEGRRRQLVGGGERAILGVVGVVE